MGFEILVLRYSLQKYTVFTDLVNFVVKIFRRTCQYLRKKKSADTEMNISFHLLLKSGNFPYFLCDHCTLPPPPQLRKNKQVGGGCCHFYDNFRLGAHGQSHSQCLKLGKNTNTLLLIFQNKKGYSMIVKQNKGRYQKIEFNKVLTKIQK